MAEISHSASEVTGAFLLLISPELCQCWHQSQRRSCLCGIPSYSRTWRRKGILRAGNLTRQNPRGWRELCTWPASCQSPYPDPISHTGRSDWEMTKVICLYVILPVGFWGLDIPILGQGYRVPPGAYCPVGGENSGAITALHPGCDVGCCAGGLLSSSSKGEVRRSHSTDRHVGKVIEIH